MQEVYKTGHLGKIIDGYTKMLNIGDDNYVKQVTTLINSDNVHEIDVIQYAADGAGGGVTPGSGMTTISEAIDKASKSERSRKSTKKNNLLTIFKS
jgi:hypothetical protein